MKTTNRLFIVVMVACLVAAVTSHAEDKALPRDVQVTKYAPNTGSFNACTHIAFRGAAEIVTAGDRLYHRTDSQTDFRASPIAGLSDAHSVVFNPHDQLFYATDTAHHQLITFRDPASRQIQTRADALAEIKLDRPHDVVVDSATGWLYALNPNNGRVFRFKGLGREEGVLDLSRHLGYSRGLTFTKGKLYVVGSSLGAVIEIIDFDKKQFTIHESFGKKKNAVAGSWKSTGLVLNDVDFFQGDWYATCYFCPTYAEGQDCNENKFIRFKTWRDFHEGDWQDLSRSLPKDVVPYFLTPRADALYIAVFCHETPGAFDQVLRLTTPAKQDTTLKSPQRPR